MQFFLGGRTSYACRSLTDKDRAEAITHCQQTDQTFYIHCPYVANLAKPVEADVVKSYQCIEKSLHQIRDLPGACVLHIGKVGSLEHVAERIGRLKYAGALKYGCSPRIRHNLLLEVAAGQGTELGKSWDEIRHLYEALDYSCAGLCIDTAHIFASGMSDLQTHESIVRLFDSATQFSKHAVSLVHLNDSKTKWLSRVDRHQALCAGEIWGIRTYFDPITYNQINHSNVDGLKALLARCKEHLIDIVSETGNPQQDQFVVDHLMTDSD
jgi:endonuclease IV